VTGRRVVDRMRRSRVESGGSGRHDHDDDAARVGPADLRTDAPRCRAAGKRLAIPAKATRRHSLNPSCEGGAAVPRDSRITGCSCPRFYDVMSTRHQAGASSHRLGPGLRNPALSLVDVGPRFHIRTGRRFVHGSHAAVGALAAEAGDHSVHWTKTLTAVGADRSGHVRPPSREGGTVSLGSRHKPGDLWIADRKLPWAELRRASDPGCECP
jgi:hypothetical protein